MEAVIEKLVICCMAVGRREGQPENRWKVSCGGDCWLLTWSPTRVIIGLACCIPWCVVE